MYFEKVRKYLILFEFYELKLIFYLFRISLRIQFSLLNTYCKTFGCFLLGVLASSPGVMVRAFYNLTLSIFYKIYLVTVQNSSTIIEKDVEKKNCFEQFIKELWYHKSQV